MSGLPKRIYAWQHSDDARNVRRWAENPAARMGLPSTEYVHIDEVQALIAGAYEAAVDAVHDECWTDGDGGPATDTLLTEQAATSLAIRAIRALTPADARAARDSMIAAAESRALDSVTTLHTVIAAIRAATVGSKPMLSELAQALVAWRDEAVTKEREACVAECQHRASFHEGIGDYHLMREAELCGAAIRKRGEG